MARLVKRAPTKPARFVIDGEGKWAVRVINDYWQKEVPIFFGSNAHMFHYATGFKERNRVL
jgi:hypothetical protein